MRLFDLFVNFLFIAFVAGQRCELKVQSYKQFTVCYDVVDKFPSNVTGMRSIQCVNCNFPIFSDETMKSFRGDSFNVSYSNIRTLDDSSFKSFWNTVKIFLLNNNQLTSIPTGVFKKFTGLKNINFASNNINNLAPKQFENVSTALLNLSQNNITEINGVFDGLRVTELNVSYNAIKEIPVGAFAEVTTRRDYTLEAESIFLQNNSITTIQPGSFKIKGTLRIINLQGNRLENIPNNTFQNLTLLGNLNLADNLLGSLEVDVFSGLKALSTLDLGNNAIAVLPFGVFRDLQQLRVLILKNNRLKELQTTTFSGLLSLVKLDISGNQLKILDDSFIFPLGKLNTLDISNNRIKEFDIETILEHHINLRTLNINNNFWLCNNLVAMYRWLNKKLGGFATPSQYYNVPNLHGIACSRVNFEVQDGMTFDDFLKFISQDMVFEDLYDVQVSGEENLEMGNGSVIHYLRDMFYMQLIITTIIVVAVCFLICLCVSSYFQKNNFAQRLKFIYSSSADNVELLK